MEESVEIGPFVVEQKIGQGGMAEVYRGRHVETEVPVAVKVIRRVGEPGARDKFHQEVQAHASLRHPGIVYLFEYGEIGDAAADGKFEKLGPESPYVAMELAESGTLRSLMPFSSWGRVRSVLVQVLDALSHAHARGVVHRDLKPANVLVFESETGGEIDHRLKLADFGIAHAFEQVTSWDTDELRSPAGTRLYMSPEQYRGAWRQYGPWTDLYTLGCVAWELTCGRPPFEGNTLMEYSIKHCERERPPLDPQFPVPEAFERWVHRMMARDPRHRFRRAADAAWSLPDFDETSGNERAADGPAVASDGPAVGGATVPREASNTRAWQACAPTLGPTDYYEEGGLEETRRQSPDAGEVRGRTSSGAETQRLEGVRPDSRPPVPRTWRCDDGTSLPAPLVGTGLGLFGLREPPFVDRSAARDAIWESLRRVADEGRCESIFISGKAGTGKSRLAEWMATRAGEVGAVRTLRALHTPEGGPTEGLSGALERTLRTLKLDRGQAYEYLEERLPRLRSDSESAIDRDARALTEYLRPTDDGAASVEGPRYRFSTARQKRAALLRVLQRLAERRPLLLWLDDLQWGSESLRLLEHIQEMPPDDRPPLLVLATVRSDVVAERKNVAETLEELCESDSADRLEIDPLSSGDQRALIEGLLPLESALADRLARRTEGHPLFAMQLLGHWIEQGRIAVGPDGFHFVDGDLETLPGDIHELWMARLEGLFPVAETAVRADAIESLELAATLGREVDAREWERLLDAVDIQVPDDLVDRLVDRGLAERTKEGWSFAHGLFVDSLKRRAERAGRLRDHHRTCARVLASDLEDVPGPRTRVAEHWAEAGEPERALDPLREEAELFDERGHEDVRRRRLERRSELLDAAGVPRGDTRRLEQWADIASLRLNAGKLDAAEPILVDVWNRAPDGAYRLRARVGDRLAILETRRGNQDKARDWARATADESAAADAFDLESQALRTLAWNARSRGNLEEAEEFASRAIELSERDDDPYGRTEAVWLRASILEARGDPRAVDGFEEALDAAEDGGYVLLEGQALNGLGEHMRFDGRLGEAREYYRAFVRKMEELSRPLNTLIGRLNLLQVVLAEGEVREALEQLDVVESELETYGARRSRAGLLHLLRLAAAAWREDRSEFERRWRKIDGAWPDDWRKVKDHPWLLETTARFLDRAGHERRRDAVLRRARKLWVELGDTRAAERVDERLSEPSSASPSS